MTLRRIAPEHGSTPGVAEIKGPKTVRVLYVFAGKQRQTSLRACLERLSSKEFEILVEEIDIVHGDSHDLSKESVRHTWLERIRRGEFDAVLCTPPCSTWTRVRMANMKGPPPLRSLQYPMGFPWLKNYFKQQAELGNILVLFMVDVYHAANEAVVSQKISFIWLFSEHPEHLGRVTRQEDKWQMDPAAIWQLEAVRQFVDFSSLQLVTLAFNQCCFGAHYKKPTRIITNLPALATWGHNGWPIFDQERNYLGPIPQCYCDVTTTLAKQHNAEEFRTTSTSAYPPEMDEALARALFEAMKSHSCLQSPSDGGIRFQDEKQEDKHVRAQSIHEDEEQGAGESFETSGSEDEAWRGKVRERGGKGPMTAYYKGKHRMIHDGGGLCSPGRWPVESRRPVRKKTAVALVSAVRREFLKWVVKKGRGGKEEFEKMARGEAKGSPFEEVRLAAREAIDKALEGLGLDPRRRPGDRDTEINFRRLAAMAEACHDEDYGYLREMAEKGVSIGVDEEMPRTPSVFEEKTKWAREFVETELMEIWADNYESAEEGKKDIWRQVDEEVESGSIKKFTEEGLKKEYGHRVAVAALGAVPKELGSEKVRLIHDGSYSVDINRRIKVRDRMRFPLIDDAAAVLVEAKEMAEGRKTNKRCSLVYDIKKAHKLIPVRKEDWALQAFRLPGERKEEGVYVHTRGTFGVASAAYYWQRVRNGFFLLSLDLCYL